MKSLTLAFYSALAAASPILDTRQSYPDTWSISNFKASSPPIGGMGYSLSVAYNKTGSSAFCSASNDFFPSQCGEAGRPGPFDKTPCSDDYWAWELQEITISNSDPPTTSLVLKISLSETEGGPVTAHGCTNLSPYNVTCTPPVDESSGDQGVVWNVPSDFTQQVISGDGDCSTA